MFLQWPEFVAENLGLEDVFFEGGRGRWVFGRWYSSFRELKGMLSKVVLFTRTRIITFACFFSHLGICTYIIMCTWTYDMCDTSCLAQDVTQSGQAKLWSALWLQGSEDEQDHGLCLVTASRSSWSCWREHSGRIDTPRVLERQG